MTTFLTYVGDDIEVCVDYNAWYQQARVSGPPEDCYPEDGEMTINSVTDSDGGEVALTDEQQERIEAEAWDHYHLCGVDGE